MAKDIKHSLATRWRAFTIWQKLGYLPWRKPKEAKKKDESFYKGAIPFLNDDAKRTFVELLLRPGYMIRDYIRGANERYLAPLAALIIFYSFFALLSAFLEPYQQTDSVSDVFEEVEQKAEANGITYGENDVFGQDFVTTTLRIVRTGYIYLTLDKHPERVKNRHQQAIAALESTLSSQGIPLFIGKLLLLWLAMSICLRRYQYSMSACATAAAYVLCQYCFLRLFTLILTFGANKSVSAIILLLVLAVDLRQMLDISWKKSIKKAISISIWYGLIAGLLIIIASFLIAGMAFVHVA